jgi:hypothetical protein
MSSFDNIIAVGSIDPTNARVMLFQTSGKFMHVPAAEMGFPTLAGNNVFTGTNEFDGVTNFDGTVDFDAAVTAVDITSSTTVQAADLVATDDLSVGDDAAITGDLTAANVTASATVQGATVTATTLLSSSGFIRPVQGGNLTISGGGSITITCSYHLVDTNGGAASDDLDTISGGGVAGTIVVLGTVNSGRDVVVRHGTGNIFMSGGANKTMGSTAQYLTFIYNGSNWIEIGGL